MASVNTAGSRGSAPYTAVVDFITNLPTVSASLPDERGPIGGPFVPQHGHPQGVPVGAVEPRLLAEPAFLDEPRLPVCPHCALVVGQDLQADLAHVQVAECIYEKGPADVLAVALAPVVLP